MPLKVSVERTVCALETYCPITEANSLSYGVSVVVLSRTVLLFLAPGSDSSANLERMIAQLISNR